MKKFKIKVNGQEYEVEVEEIKEDGSGVAAVQEGDSSPAIKEKAAQAKKLATTAKNEQQPAPKSATPKAGAGAPGGVKAPMPGVINSVNVKTGDTVKTGDVLCILEAMKLENEIQADRDGTVTEIYISQGQNVNAGDVLMVIE